LILSVKDHYRLILAIRLNASFFVSKGDLLLKITSLFGMYYQLYFKKLVELCLCCYNMR
jgi:hypothetical protein